MRRQRTPVARCALACALFLVQTSAAQEFKNNGTAGFTFLEVPVTARTAALGEASLALADVHSASVFDNPAALGFTDRTHSMSASYAPWFAEIRNYAASYAVKTGLGVFGVGLVVFDYGTMPRTVVAQGQKVYEITGTFGAKSLAAGLTYSVMLTDKFAFGATVKYAREAIDTYAAGNVLFDGGVLYYTGLGTFRIAASIHNFGINAKFINDEFKMPSVLKLGAAVDVLGDEGAEHRLTLLAQAFHPNDAPERVNVGGEYSWDNIIAFRAGYKFFTDEESYSAGVGITPRPEFPVGLDIAYAEYGRLGGILRFTVQLELE